MMRNRVMTTGAMLAAAALLLAGCSRSEPEQPEEANMAEVAPLETATPEALPSAEPTPEPAAIDLNAVDEAPPPEKIAPDAQMLDDADATGMTARVTRDAPPPPTDNGQAPQ
ncbi:hypothetical protein [Sphingomonas sp. CLY1604]|uniref:hypothetical protein n=1 Tax=Sphingomonas sp. CLY1604 TaxID=3457786 RepID=UPI003FD84297